MSVFGLSCGDGDEPSPSPSPSPTPTTKVAAAFSATPTLGKAPLAVQFTDESTGSVNSWAWDFTSDGTVDSTSQNPSHTYDTVGNHTVSLKVTGTDGSEDTEVKIGYIRVGDLIAGFTPTPAAGFVPLAVQFTDDSVGDITAYAWDFTDDGSVDSTAQNPSHTYDAAGIYTPTLTVTGPEGTDTYAYASIIVEEIPELTAQTWKLSHGFGETSVRGKGAEKFKELVEAATGGKITVDVYPNSTLFYAHMAPQALIDGTIQVTWDPPYYWGSRVKWLPLLYTWGLFENWDHALGVMGSAEWAAAMEPEFTPFGVQYLGMTMDGMGCVYVTNKAAVTDFMDMAGWKDGIPTGSSPTAGPLVVDFDIVYVTWGQEQPAIIAGTIDTYAMAVSTAVGQQCWTFCDYAIAGTLASGSLPLMNQATFDALPAYWQNVIMTEVMPQVIQYGYHEGKTTEAVEMATLTDNLVAFNVMSEAQMATFLAAQMELDIMKVLMFEAGEHIMNMILDWEPG